MLAWCAFATVIYAAVLAFTFALCKVAAKPTPKPGDE